MNIGLQRLHRQGIIKSKFKDPEEVVSRLAGIQGQDYPGAKWSISLRIPGLTDTDIENAIAEKKIIRTWPMRGTLHFVASKDIRWILKLLAPRLIDSLAFRDKQLGLTPRIYERSETILKNILAEGGQLTREEINAALKKGKITADGVQLSHILQRAGLHQIVCYGVRRGKQFTYTLLDEWLAGQEINYFENPLAELTIRYFRSRGPASLEDYIWWSGLKAADARRGIDIIKNELNELKQNGRIYYQTKDILKVKIKSPMVHLLPGFDEYLLGYKNRSDILDPEYIPVLNAGGGIISPTVIIDGIVRGTWKRVINKNKVELHVKLLNSFTNTEMDAVHEAAKRYGKFLEMGSVMYVK